MANHRILALGEPSALSQELEATGHSVQHAPLNRNLWSVLASGAWDACLVHEERLCAEVYDLVQHARETLPHLALLVAAEDADVVPTLFLFLVGIPLGLALFWWSGTYYTQHYGRVQQPANAEIELCRIGTIFAAAITSFLIDRTLQPPIWIAPLVVAAGWIVMLVRLGRPYRWHYLAAALVVVGIDLALPLLVAPDSPFLRPGFVLWATIGLSLIITGFFDHLLLARTLRPVVEE